MGTKMRDVTIFQSDLPGYTSWVEWALFAEDHNTNWYVRRDDTLEDTWFRVGQSSVL